VPVSRTPAPWAGKIDTGQIEGTHKPTGIMSPKYLMYRKQVVSFTGADRIPSGSPIPGLMSQFIVTADSEV
jgi:hypothetical protein